MGGRLDWYLEAAAVTHMRLCGLAVDRRVMEKCDTEFKDLS